MDTRAARYFKWLLFWRQQGRCCYCGEHVVLTYRPYDAARPYAATLEHLQRRADGGTGAIRTTWLWRASAATIRAASVTG